MEGNNSEREDEVGRKRRVEGERKKRESLTATCLPDWEFTTQMTLYKT